VRKELEEAAERDAVARLHGSILDALLEANPFEVPASMVALQLDDYCQEFAAVCSRQGIDPRKVNWGAYRQKRMLDAERAVRSGYLLQAIGNTEDIQVSDAEIEAEIRTLMADQKIQQSFEAFKAELERRGANMEIKGRIRTEKIFQRLASYSKVSEEWLDKAAFEALSEIERKREEGIPQARFDAGGVGSSELESQEGGEPAAVKADDETAPTADQTTTSETEAAAPKAKKATRKAESPKEKVESTKKGKAESSKEKVESAQEKPAKMVPKK
jgi:trigger factor